MPNLNLRAAGAPALLALFALLLISAPVGAGCRSESEIPSNTPMEDFTDHGDGTVTHHRTGLMWMKCPLGQGGPDCASGSATTVTWQGALEAAAASSFAGHNDWRVPNAKELRSIVEHRCYSPAINLSVFPNPPPYAFWSSSPNAAYPGVAYGVNFVNGGHDLGNHGSYRHVRLVRSGQ